MLFGASMPSKFGTPYGTPPIFNPNQGNELDVPNAPQAPKKRGLFGGMFSGEVNINPKLAMLSQIVAGMSGRQSPAFMMWQAQDQQRRAEAMRQQARQEDWTDWQAKQQWERDNPKPSQPDDFTRSLIASGIDPNSPEGQAAYAKRVQHWNDPTVNMTLPNGQFYSGPQSGLAAALRGVQPPTQPVGKLTPIGGQPGGTGPFNADYGAFKRAIIGQETGGTYGILNREGSGAMGVGQQMPPTAQTLAGRLGLPWRPDLMRGKSGEAKAYQDKITDAAVREAWNYGQSRGDVRQGAMYYFGGSNRKIWGPKTRQYGDNIMTRLRGR